MFNRNFLANTTLGLSPSSRLSSDVYRYVAQHRGLAPTSMISDNQQTQIISGGRDMLRTGVVDRPGSDLGKYESPRIGKIVNNVTQRNTIFSDMDRTKLDEILKLYIGKMSYEELISTSEREMEMQIERIMATEHFLDPGFFVEMPPRKKTTVKVTIGSVRRGTPSPPDFEE